MDAGRRPYWWEQLDGGEGSQWLSLLWKGILQLQQLPSVLSPSTWCVGPVCTCFATLRTTLSLIVSFVQMTWCALTAKQSCLIAVVKISARRGTFPVRYLFPFSIYASVRNLLGHLVSNKKKIPYFNLLQGLWIFAYLFVSPFDKLQQWSLF